MATIKMSFEHYIKIVTEWHNRFNQDKAKIEKELHKIELEQFYEDAKRAYTQIINNWYDSYSPNIYDRHETLKKAAKFTLTSDYVDVTLYSDPLSGHRLENDMLYQLTMRRGYHGGAMDSNSGVYRYRTPHPIYTKWGDPAIQTFSPVRAMRNWVASYESTVYKEKRVKRILDKYYSKYEYYRLKYM